MSLAVYTSQPDGTNRVPLDNLGPVGGVRFANAASGGDVDCSLTLDIPADANPPALTLGRSLFVADGPMTVWSGLLADPKRGSPWQITGQSLSSLGGNYLALDSDSQITADPNTAIDQAIARGLPWIRTIDLPTTTVANNGSDVASLMDAVALGAGSYWQVDTDSHVQLAELETDPSLILASITTPGGRTVDAFATDVWAKYVSIAYDADNNVIAGPTLYVAADANPALSAPRPFGRVEAVYDATPAGPITSDTAQTMADGALALSKPQPSFTGDLTITPGALTSVGGQPVRLSTVRAGRKVRMVGVQPDPVLGEQVFAISVDIVIGQWEYDADSDTAKLTPLGAAKRDLASILRAASATTQQQPWSN